MSREVTLCILCERPLPRVGWFRAWLRPPLCESTGPEGAECRRLFHERVGARGV